MAHQKLDSIQFFVTGTGTGPLTVGAATSAKYRTPTGAGMANADTFYGRVQNTTAGKEAEWQDVLITYNAGQVTFTFDARSASPTGALIAFTSGTIVVSGAALAKVALQMDNNGDSGVTRDFAVGRDVAATRDVSVGRNLAVVGKFDAAKGADIASAATTDIGAATGNYINVTGSVNITALGTAQAGAERWVQFAAALTLTHNATSLILPLGRDLVTAAGDLVQFMSEGGGNWRLSSHVRPTLVGGLVLLTAIGVNFNSANSDNSIPVVLPPGFTRFQVDSVRISKASQTITTATSGLFTAAAGGGTAIVANAVHTTSVATEGTNNNSESRTVANSNTQSYLATTVTNLFFRVGTAQGAAATADVTIALRPLP